MGLPVTFSYSSSILSRKTVDTSDNALMSAVAAGTVSKLAILFERHHRSLYRYFISMTRDPQTSEDLVQDVFFRILRYRATYDPQHPATPSEKTVAAAQAMFPVKYPFTTVKLWDNTTGMTAAELQNTLAILRSGRPVATGIWWLNTFATLTVDGVPLLKDYPRSANSGPNPPMFDGHSIDLVGFRESRSFPGGGYFVFRNSFGPSFGNKGYGFVSFQYIRAYANDAIAISAPPRRKAI